MRPQIILFGDSITELAFKYGGWGASLTDTYSRKADILVRGYGGYTTRWALFLLHHIFPLVSTIQKHPYLESCSKVKSMYEAAYKHIKSAAAVFVGQRNSSTPPVATTVFLGANDAALPGRYSERQHVPLEEYKENLRKIVRHLKECSPTMLTVLITPPPIDEEGRLQYSTSAHGEKAMKLPERTNEVTGSYANGCVEVAKELGVSSVDLWSKMQETQGWQRKFLSDGLHLTPDGNKVVYEEVVKVFNGAWLSAPEMPADFPHHLEIDPQNPAKVFQERCL